MASDKAIEIMQGLIEMVESDIKIIKKGYVISPLKLAENMLEELKRALDEMKDE